VRLPAIATPLCFLITAVSLRAQSPSQADTLSGLVTDATTRAPISGAAIFVTRGPDRLLQRDTADASGRWRTVFAPGTGDYLVFISAPGYSSIRRRVTRAGTETRFTVDAVLAATSTAQLQTVRVQAERPRPGRSDPASPAPTVGSNERAQEGVGGAVPPGQAGSPLAAASTIPGLNVNAAGVSALGAGADQSLVTLNGLAAGARLPRAAQTTTRGSISNFDAAVGGFSGALVAQVLDPGGEDTERNGSMTLDAPALRTSDALATAFGQRPLSFQASYGQRGQLVDNRLFYHVAAQASRSSASQASLLTASPRVLALDGLDPTDVSAAQAAFATIGVPAPGTTPALVEDAVNLVAQLDRTPRARRALRMTGLLDARRTTGSSLAPTSLADAVSRGTDIQGALQVGASGFYGTNTPVLNEFKSSLSLRTTERSPGRATPTGLVRVPDLATNPTDPDATVPTLTIAGFNGPTGRASTLTWETVNDASWLRGGRRHLFKVHGWSRVDATQDATIANALGTWSFNTLDDLRGGRPSAFTRTLAQPERTGATWNAASAATYRWAPSRQFSLLLGARAEMNRFLTSPDGNPALSSALGVRTDALPSSWGISPRAGMTWYLVRETAGGLSQWNSNESRKISLPAGMIRAGIGEFRGIFRPGLAADADGATGLPDAVRRLTCVGAAAPAPFWSPADSRPVPSACAGGASGLTDDAPPVIALSPALTPPRNWRASTGYTTRFGFVDVRADATVALNRNQPGFVDRNFGGVPQFALVGEGGRPVFVPATAIDTARGGVSPVSARRSNSFGMVAERVSDLRGRAGQFTLSLAPDFSALRNVRLPGDLFLLASYTWASARGQARGFDAGTAGDPSVIEWARTPDDIRHQWIVNLSSSIKDLEISLFLRAESGRPFTPLVSGDINGDGRTNDRAFIPTAGLEPVLASAPASVRRCLDRQRGSIAARNSCEGPWSQSLQARFVMPGRRLGLPPTSRIALQLVNPLGALDRALHGADGLRGWGTPSLPDPVLLVPRGFSASSGSFRYDVNPRFGETRPSRLSRPIEPFGVTLDIALDLTTNREQQELKRQLKPGRNGDSRPRLGVDSLRARYQRSIPSLYTTILAFSDTLLLSGAQQDSLNSMELRYRRSLDSLFTPLAEYLAALPDQFNGREALERVQRVDSLAWDIAYASAAPAYGTLSGLQFGILANPIRRLLTEQPEEARRHRLRYEIIVTPTSTSFSISRQ
jgi:hypothetical protein